MRDGRAACGMLAITWRAVDRRTCDLTVGTCTSNAWEQQARRLYASEFRDGLVDRKGLAAVDALEADEAPRHYTSDDLQELDAELLRKLKQIVLPANVVK
jgi:hypothetical protein